MQEEYLLKKMMKGKTEEEIRIEIMQSIIETKEKLKIARCNFEYAEDDMIDYYSYQIKANQSKLDYLIKIAKSKGIVLSRENEIKARNFRKNNVAVQNICPEFIIEIVVITTIFLEGKSEYKYTCICNMYLFNVYNWKNIYSAYKMDFEVNT